MVLVAWIAVLVKRLEFWAPQEFGHDQLVIEQVMVSKKYNRSSTGASHFVVGDVRDRLNIFLLLEEGTEIQRNCLLRKEISKRIGYKSHTPSSRDLS